MVVWTMEVEWMKKFALCGQCSHLSHLNTTIRELYNLTYTTSHQHQITTLSKLKRDYCNLGNVTCSKEKIIIALYAIFNRPIFEKYCYRRNCQKDVNVHNLDMIGKKYSKKYGRKTNFLKLIYTKWRMKNLFD